MRLPLLLALGLLPISESARAEHTTTSVNRRVTAGLATTIGRTRTEDVKAIKRMIGDISRIVVNSGLCTATLLASRTSQASGKFLSYAGHCMSAAVEDREFVINGNQVQVRCARNPAYRDPGQDPAKISTLPDIDQALCVVADPYRGAVVVSLDGGEPGACLPQSPPATSSRVTGCGYGPDDTRSRALACVSTKVDVVRSQQLHLNDEGDPALTRGDSGGPTFQRQDGKLMQVGIASTSIAHGSRNTFLPSGDRSSTVTRTDTMAFHEIVNRLAITLGERRPDICGLRPARPDHLFFPPEKIPARME